MAIWKRKKNEPSQLIAPQPGTSNDSDELENFTRFANQMQSEMKSFDWSHYQAMASGGVNQMFGGEFNTVPTIRITKGMYIQEPWINACTNAITRQFLGSRFVLKKRQTADGQMQTVAKHGLLDYLRTAGAQNESLAFFVSNAVADLVLTGNAYWWTSKDLKDKKRIPSERIEPVIVDNRITRYRLSTAGDGPASGGLELSPEEVVHIKLPNPFSSHVGISMIIATVLPVLINKYGMEYVVAFFLRGGNTSGIIQTKTSNMEQLLKLARTIQQAFGGRKNMHADKILPEGAEWKGQGNSFSEIRLIEMLKDNMSHFRAATGCTNTVLGISENVNRATAFAEMEQFWLSTILPMQQVFCAGVTSSSLWDRFGLDESWELHFDNSNIIYLDDFDRRLEQDSKLAGTWTINERRERLGKKVITGYDKLASEMVGPPGGSTMLTFAMPSTTVQPTEQLAIDAEVTEPLGKWKAEEAQIQEPTPAAESVFGKEFDAWEKIFLDNLEDKAEAVRKVQARADDFAETVKDKLLKPALKAYDNQMSHVSQAKYLRLSTVKGLVVTKETEEDRKAKLAALRLRAEDVLAGKIFDHGKDSFLGFSQTAMDTVYDFIAAELEAGKSLADVAASVRLKYREAYGVGENYSGQAETILRTEFGAAISIGQAQFGTDLSTVTKRMRKEWVTMGDNFVRSSHEDAEKDPIDADSSDIIDAQWLNGLRYPRDPDGEPGDVINCRCTIRYVPVEWA